MESTKTIQKVLIIDLENCQNQIKELINHLKNFSHIIICYTKTTTTIPFDWILPIHEAIKRERLKITKVPEGKNAADFEIAFQSIEMMKRLQKETQFTILSDDKDFDNVVNFLKRKGRKAERITGKQKENLDKNKRLQ